MLHIEKHPKNTPKTEKNWHEMGQNFISNNYRHGKIVQQPSGANRKKQKKGLNLEFHQGRNLKMKICWWKTFHFFHVCLAVFFYANLSSFYCIFRNKDFSFFTIVLYFSGNSNSKILSKVSFEQEYPLHYCLIQGVRQG